MNQKICLQQIERWRVSLRRKASGKASFVYDSKHYVLPTSQDTRGISVFYGNGINADRMGGAAFEKARG